MAELYNRVKFANSTFVPQFIGSNADEIKDLGQTLDTRYRQNRDLSDRLAIAMANDKYHEADQYVGDAIHKQFANTIEEVANSDANFENSSGIVANAGRDYATNRNRIVALENNQKYQDYIAKKQELGAEAEDFTPDFKGSFNPDGSINRFSHKLEKKIDKDKEKETFFNQIESSLLQELPKGTNIAGLLSSQITGGISEPIIEAYANKALTRYKSAGTGAYEQEKRILIRDTPELEKNPKEIDEIIKKSILAVGLERVHNISKQDLQNLHEWQVNGSRDKAPPFVPTIPGAAKVNTSIKPLTTAESSLYKDQTGKTYQVTEKNGTLVNYPDAQKALNRINSNIQGGGTYKLSDIYNIKETTPYEANTLGTVEYQYEHLANNMSERQKRIIQQDHKAGWTIKDYNNEKQTADTKARQVVESGEQLTEQNTAIYANYLRGAGLNSPTILEGETEPKTLKEITDSLNLDAKDKIEYVPNLLNRVSSNAQMGANIEGTIYVNGQPKKNFVTRLSDQFDSASTELNDIFQHSLYQGSDTYTKSQPKVSNQVINKDGEEYVPVYYTTTVPTGRSKYPYDTEVHVGISKVTGYQPDGTPIIQEPEYNGESYTADQFKTKQTEISKNKLKNTYASGHMTDLDVKRMGPN